MNEFVCVQDEREKELQEQGYTRADKVYFRIGRAIFVIDTLSKDFTKGEAAGTPIGAVAKLNNPDLEFAEEELKQLQELFGSTKFLRLICEGDPDCGFAAKHDILLTGYRGGLDDVIVESKLLQTVHGSAEDIMRNFAESLDWRSKWISVPRWETYDGRGYRIKYDTPLKDEFADVADKVRSIAEKFEHKDDMPDWVKEKFHNSDTGGNGNDC